MTYRQLIVQYKSLDEMSKHIDEKKRKNENTDYLRRKYNTTARAYNHKLSTFVGKIIAKELDYASVEIIAKEDS